MYEINIQRSIPIYDQLLKMILSQIISGILKANDQLPSVRDMAKQISINPNTVSKAYKELEREKIIYSVPGKGSYVSDIDRSKVESCLLNEFENQVQLALNMGFTKDDLKKKIDGL